MKKYLLIILFVFVSYNITFAMLDNYPKTTLSELATSTLCDSCDAAYSGLNVVQQNYDYSEFISVRYYDSAGDYGTSETDAAINYYNVSEYPTAIFNGNEEVIGAGCNIASGETYLAVMDSEYFEPSPIRIYINSFDPETGNISASVKMYSPDDTLNNVYIRFILLEDNVADNHTHITRDIISEPFSLVGQGNCSDFNKVFNIDGTWNTDELFAVVFVQDNDKNILQAISTYQIPDYKIRAMVPFSTTQIIPNPGFYIGDFFAIVNYGLEDSLTINVYADSIPEGWYYGYCDTISCFPPGPHTFTLAPDEYNEFHIDINVNATGIGYFHFEVTSANSDSVLIIPLKFITDNLSVDPDFQSSSFIINLNYPNPFSTSTTISFNLATDLHGLPRINIYNIKGQLVTHFAIRNPQSELTKVVWDGKDENGRRLTNGIYFYSLKVGSYQETKKMLLLR